MTTEEKAQTYDAAIKQAKKELATCGSQDCDAYRQIIRLFPELKESEDEKIRKNCIHFLELQKQHHAATFEIEECIAWLEKQDNVDKASYEIAEKEKDDFVSGQFIECRKSFDEFKEDNSYWLEYIGNDTYIGRSDNILNKTFHITPRQLFTLFTQQHCPKGDSNVNDETNAPTEYGKYVDECLNEASKHFFSEGEDKYSVADLFYAGVRCGKSWFEKQGKQDPVDKVEPKFKVGDWITDGQLTCKVLSRISKSYELHLYNDDYCHFETDVQSIDEHYHLWSIADAKDGDVLTNGEMTVIFKHFEEPSYRQHIIAYIGLDRGGCIQITDDTWSLGIDKAKPATKKQRDLLFAKMKEEGYRWDSEEKRLIRTPNTATWQNSRN